MAKLTDRRHNEFPMWIDEEYSYANSARPFRALDVGVVDEVRQPCGNTHEFVQADRMSCLPWRWPGVVRVDVPLSPDVLPEIRVHSRRTDGSILAGIQPERFADGLPERSV